MCTYLLFEIAAVFRASVHAPLNRLTPAARLTSKRRIDPRLFLCLLRSSSHCVYTTRTFVAISV